MIKRTVSGVCLLLVVALFGHAVVLAQESNPQERTRKSWSLEFRTHTPQLHIHETAKGERVPYLYITYTLRNNYSRKLPLQLNFVLKTSEGRYHPATSVPEVNHEIIQKEAQLSGFSKGVQREKIKNLKKEGKYLTVDDLNRGFYLHHVSGEGITEHEIQPLSIRSIGSSRSDEDRIPYQVLIREGPSGSDGTFQDKRLTEHPAEIKGLLVFQGVDLNSRHLKLKVGNLIDPIVRVQSTDVPAPKKYRLEPRTLHVNWTWKVSRSNKRNIGPEFVGHKMVKERFGPVVSRETLSKLIDYLSIDLGQSSHNGGDKELDQTLRGTALQTLRDLTGQQFGYEVSDSPSENQDAIERWNEWLQRNKNDLLYVLVRPESDDSSQELFYQYPRPRYIAVKKRVSVSGAETPQKLFDRFKTAWNEQRWQEVMDSLIIDQRKRSTLKTLFDRFGFDTKIGVVQNYQETDEEAVRVVAFKVGENERTLQIEREGGEWFLSVETKSTEND